MAACSPSRVTCKDGHPESVGTCPETGRFKVSRAGVQVGFREVMAMKGTGCSSGDEEALKSLR